MRLEVGGGLLLHFLEQECTKSRITLDRIMYYIENGRPLYENTMTGMTSYLLENGPEVVGYIIMAVNSDPAHAQVMNHLSFLKKTVAVLTNLQLSHLRMHRKNSRFFRHFVTGTTKTPGKKVGEFLRNRGHCKIAYFSIFSGLTWSQRRVEGIRESFREAGFHNAVSHFPIDDTPYPHDFDHANAPSRYLMTTLEQSLRKIKPHLPFDMYNSFEQDVENFVKSRWRFIDNAFRLNPLFEQAKNQADITAWVCENDVVALCALNFLQSKNIPVPRRISLIGFDNSFEAASRLITSYDFNMSGLAHALLGYLLKSGYFVVQRSSNTTELTGMVVGRMTTASV